MAGGAAPAALPSVPGWTRGSNVYARAAVPRLAAERGCVRVNAGRRAFHATLAIRLGRGRRSPSTRQHIFVCPRRARASLLTLHPGSTFLTLVGRLVAWSGVVADQGRFSGERARPADKAPRLTYFGL